MNIILGLSAASGTGIGNAFILPETKEKIIPQKEISPEEHGEGWRRFEEACETVRLQIDQSLKSLPKDNLQRIIFETYQLMLADPVFTKEVQDAYETGNYNIEFILDKKVKQYAGRLRSSGNDYLAERSKDIEDVFGRVQDILLDYHPFNIEEVPDNAVIVAHSMKTSDTVVLGKRKIAGLALTEGGTSSHVAILAKSYGIPAVVGLENVADEVTQGELVIVDGNRGEIIIAPDSSAVQEYRLKIEVEKKYRASLLKFRNKGAQTKDGTKFKVFANIGTPEEAQIALEEGADGIGLFRTEFLFMNAMQPSAGKDGILSHSVSEETQFEAYREVLQMMGDRPVTIRTLDAGGDKLIDFKEIPALNEKNPLMGLRAIRLALYYPQILRTQLRALYRASIYGNLRILLPLITDVAQVETVKGIAKGVRISLREENIPFKEVPIGIMIETPAAALCADELAEEVDFFSLGTNDLTQYTCAIDRQSANLERFSDTHHPAVLRLIRETIEAGHRHGTWVGICGELGADPTLTEDFLKWGVDELSVNPKSILPLRGNVRNVDLAKFKTETPKPEHKPETKPEEAPKSDAPQQEVKAEAPKQKGFFGRLFG